MDHEVLDFFGYEFDTRAWASSMAEAGLRKFRIA
jgi:hypothetical protein